MVKYYYVDKKFFKISFRSNKECNLDRNCPQPSFKSVTQFSLHFHLMISGAGEKREKVKSKGLFSAKMTADGFLRKEKGVNEENTINPKQRNIGKIVSYHF